MIWLYGSGILHSRRAQLRNSVVSFLVRSLPAKGWSATHDAGTDADVVLNPGDSIQTAVDAAHASGQPTTIALRGGRYFETVAFPSGATGITLKRYGQERPVISGGELITGWAPATSADEAVLGSGYASVYRATIPAPAKAPHVLNLHHGSNLRYIAQDRAGYVDSVTGVSDPHDRAFVGFDRAFYETGVTYSFDGGGKIVSVTAPAIFGAYTASQLSADGVLIAVYCDSNNVVLAEITSYDAGTHTAQISQIDLAAQFRASATGREAISLVNLPAAIRTGDWAAVRDGGNYVVYYKPFSGEAPGLDSQVEYSVREYGIDLGTCTDITLEGLEVVQFDNDNQLRATCIGSSSPGRRDSPKTNLTIRHCKVGGTTGADYGALLVSHATGLRMERVTIENVDGYGAFLRNSSDTICTGIHVKDCAQAGLRVYSTLGILLYDVLFERNGRGGHSNQLNFYEGCDNVTVAFLETRECYGYCTWQEASNVTWYMCRIQSDREAGNTGRGLMDQQRGAGDNQGGPDGSGAPVAGTDFKFINLDVLPYDIGQPNSVRVGGGPGTNERSIILNSVMHGGGNIDVYTNGFPASLDVRAGNIYTGTSFWQTSFYGWELEPTEAVVPLSAVYTDSASGDYSPSENSVLRGSLGENITSHVVALEALWPGYDFRRDLDGEPIDPATPPIGAQYYRGGVYTPNVVLSPALFLIAGQSNSAGYAPVDGGPFHPDGTKQWTTAEADAVVPLSHQTTNSGRMGFDVQFAIDYMQANPGRYVVFIPAGANGTSFQANDWNPGNSEYNTAVARANSAIAHYGVGLEGILWHQGESDASALAPYQAALDTMIASMRADITGASEVPWVLGEVYPSNASEAAINAVIADTPSRMPYTAAFSTADLTLIDSHHYNAASMRVMGTRYLAQLPNAAANVPTAPGISGVPTITGTETENEAMTATPAATTGLPAPTTTWQWMRSGVAIAGATSAAYTPVTADVGETLTVVQTATNASGAATATSAATGAIQAAPAPSGPTVEAGALAHWVFGTDNPTSVDLVSSQALQPRDQAPTVETSAINPQDGADKGIMLGYADTLDRTLCFVAQVNSSGSMIFGGTGLDNGVNDGSAFIVYNGNIVYNNPDSGQTLRTLLSKPPVDTWLFFGMSYNAAGNEIAVFVGGTGTNESRTYTSTVNTTGTGLGLGNTHFSSSSWSNNPKIAEAIVIDGYKDVSELEAIWQRSAARLGPRGIVIAP